MRVKSNLTALIIGTGLFISCSSSSNTSETQYTNPHAEMHKKEHQEFNNQQNQEIMNNELIQSIAGNYLGMIPCADCEKIIYRLQLNEDKSYKSRITYKGKSDTPIEKEGSFKIDSNQNIVLDGNSGSMNMLKASDYGLILLDKNGKLIEGDLADKYVLLPMNKSGKQTKDVRLQQILMQKQKEGIDFYAFGNDPSWNLNMDLDKVFTFKSPEGTIISVPSVDPVKAMDANVSRYRAVTEGHEIIIQTQKTSCSDNDVNFKYSVKVDYKLTSEKDYKTVEGCGMYIPDYRLHNIWAVKEVNGTMIERSNFKKDSPRIEIFVSEGRVHGTDGCNNFNGSVEIEEDRIMFGPMASTMMACIANQEVSAMVMKTFASKNLTYKIESNHLILSQEGKEVMKLQNID